MKNLSLFVISLFFLGACSPVSSTPESVSSPTQTPSSIPVNTVTPLPSTLWVGSAVPPALRDVAYSLSIPLVNDRDLAAYQLDIEGASPATSEVVSKATWIYALVAPFPTLLDGVTANDLRTAWSGSSSGPMSEHPLLMDSATLAAFTALWGEPASSSVEVVPTDKLVDEAWREIPSWGIVPFEDIQPRLKVLAIDDQSPIHKDFDASSYPLQVNFVLTQKSNSDRSITLPSSNRDAAKLTTVILTGVTALVRGTAYTMETKGVTYPGSSIRDILRQADITHISNEVPFDADCPYPNPRETSLAGLCSQPAYVDLLTDVGADVVELTGDHFDNRGTQAMFSTLELYKEKGLSYYGGGVNIQESQKPLLIEKDGNKLAFIGCNAKEYSSHATDTIPGAAPCDFDYMTNQVKMLREQGYLPIVTFQDYEYYSPEARPGQMERFRMMADAGAVVVSGSQAHSPQMMEFHNDVFIHYGLGNLFFDQMTYNLPGGNVTERTRDEFIDRHVFYNGHYLGVELLTAILEDYSRPQWMTNEERLAFLSDYFYASNWIPFSPTPTPAPTATLTPLALPPLISTPTP